MLIKSVLLTLNFFFASCLSAFLIESETSNLFAFPKNFSFGASTAAYQIEGGSEEDEKGPSIWDTLVHEHPEMISDGTNGDVGDDSYHHYMDDIKALSDVGVIKSLPHLMMTIVQDLLKIKPFFSFNIIDSQSHGQEYSLTELKLIRKLSIIITN